VFIGSAQDEATESALVLVEVLGQIQTSVFIVNGELRKGDIITAIPIIGTAMKATEPGILLETALEDFSV
jgi:hypothetical protein